MSDTSIHNNRIITGFADAAVEPVEFTDAPTPAVKKLLQRCKLSIDQGTQLSYQHINGVYYIHMRTLVYNIE